MRNNIIYLVLLIFVVGCIDDQKWADAGSTVPPEKVSVLEIQNINGGAHIIYDQLKGEDVIGVKASFQYNVNGDINEVYASAASDTLTVRGFADTLSKSVTLVAVNSNGIESEPNEININPDTPPVKLAALSVQLKATIGGVRLLMNNLDGNYMSAILEYRENESEEWEYHDDILRTTLSDINVKFLNIESKEWYFRVRLIDEFNNEELSEVVMLKPTSIEDGIYDVEGNHYSIVAIGSQLWLGENLKVTKYRDGTDIPNVTENEVWNALEYPAYCWQNNDEANYKKYGAFYNWFVVDPESTGGKIIAPEGTHVPSDEEWKQLELFLGMQEAHLDESGWGRGTNQASQLASEAPWKGGKLKSDGAFASSGFDAYPVGRRSPFGGLERFNQCAFFWSTDDLGTSAWVRGMFYSNNRLNREPQDKKWGFNIRCLLDD